MTVRATSSLLSCAAAVLFALCVLPTTACAGLVNVALNKPASADSVYSSYAPSHAVDGDPGTNWSSTSQGTEASPHWLMVDLEQAYSIDQIVLTLTSSSYVGYDNVYNLYGSLDSSNWTLIGSGTLIDTTDPQDVWPTNGTSMRYIKHEVVGGSHWAGLGELEAFVVPEPASLSLLAVGGLALLSLAGLRRHGRRLF